MGLALIASPAIHDSSVRLPIMLRCEEKYNVLLSFVAAAPVAASGLCEHLDVHSELFGENLELPGLRSPRRRSSTRVTPRPLQEKELSVRSAEPPGFALRGACPQRLAFQPTLSRAVRGLLCRDGLSRSHCEDC